MLIFIFADVRDRAPYMRGIMFVQPLRINREVIKKIGHSPSHFNITDESMPRASE